MYVDGSLTDIVTFVVIVVYTCANALHVPLLIHAHIAAAKYLTSYNSMYYVPVQSIILSNQYKIDKLNIFRLNDEIMLNQKQIYGSTTGERKISRILC